MQKIPNDKINPITKYFAVNETCLHAAAYYNNVDLFGFIIEKVEEKNPSVNEPQRKGYDQTLLHLAAAEGNLEICKIIIANIGDLSCLDEKYYGKTPFETARDRRHLNICFYFNEVTNQSSLDIGRIFHKNVGIYFLEESESTKAVGKTAVTTTATETTSLWSKFWK